MLFRRTCKLVEFENATKALEKAKPKNQEAVSYPGEDIFIIIPTTFKARLGFRLHCAGKKLKTHQMFSVLTTPEEF